MTLFKLFYFTNFFSCLFKKRRNSFWALWLELKCYVKILCPRYTNMTLLKLFYFTNFFSCLFKKRRNGFGALAAGIKVFGPRKFF